MNINNFNNDIQGKICPYCYQEVNESHKETIILKYKENIKIIKIKAKFVYGQYLLYYKDDISDVYINILNIDVNNFDNYDLNKIKNLINETITNKNIQQDNIKNEIELINNNFDEYKTQVNIKYKEDKQIFENAILEIENIINTKQINRQELYDEITSITNKIESIQMKKNEIKNEIENKCEQLLKDFQESLKEIYKEKINKYKDGIDEIENTYTIENNYMTSLQIEKSNIENEIEKNNEIVIKISNLQTQINSITSEMNNKNKHKEDHNEKKILLISNIKDTEDEIEILKFWIKAFTNNGIKNILLDEVIPFLNERCNYYCNYLLQSKIQIEFTNKYRGKDGSIDRFEIIVHNNKISSDNEIKYNSLSGGEKRMIDLVVLFVLQDLSRQYLGQDISFVLYDEIFDSLDTENIEYVSKVLNEQKNDKEIIIISHVLWENLEYDKIVEM
jgi:DNA repair exonuclease SbcCD ATPase subunit